jgi:TRAP transporter 4TM/12TM fusion protein
VDDIIMSNGMANSGMPMWRWLKEHPVGLIYGLLTGYVFYSYFSPLPPHQGRALFLLIVFVGLFLKPFPPEAKKRLKWLDWILAVGAVVGFGYVVLFQYQIGLRAGLPTKMDVWMGLLTIALTIEATRRGMGNAMLAIVCVFLLYFLFGQYIPPAFGGHVGYSLKEIVDALYLSTELDGIFGVSTYVFFRYIFLFFLYGNLLLRTGATNFIMDLIVGLVGTKRGGAAMAAVTGSGAMGSISGLAMGNVMITGVVTIPLMKKTGFKPWVAAAVEAAASSGGQIMPPIMGTASFLMMTFLAVPYSHIIKAAIIPALLFYLAILASVYFYAVRVGAVGLDRAALPKMRKVLKRSEGLTFVSSFAVLVSLIAMRFSPMLSVTYAILTAFVVSFFTPSRLNLKKIAELIYETGVGFVGLGAAAAGIGIVIGASLETGLAFGMTSLLLNWTGGQLVPTLIAVFIACFFLGMGLPPVIVYIISALLGAPALVQLGITPMAAHLFCFYAAICCEVSPPIAPAAYVAALVADTDFWKVCLFSMMFSIAAHILPFAFALDSSMLLIGGSLVHTIWVVTTACVGVIIMSWGIAGPFRGYISSVGRIMSFVGGVLLIFPGTLGVVLGGGLALFGVAWHSWKDLSKRFTQAIGDRKEPFTGKIQ